MAERKDKERGGLQEGDGQGEGKTGSEITQRAHQTFPLFTHEPQACYSRVSVECQQWLNSNSNTPQCGQSRHFPCDSEVI